MEVNVYRISKNLALQGLADIAFSFRPFVNDIKQRIAAEQTVRGEFYKLTLNKLNHYPEIENPLTSDEAIKYTDILELIYAVLSPPVTDESEFYWAIGSPVPADVIYSTSAFKEFIQLYNRDQDTIVNQGEEVFKKRLKEFVYRLLLKKMYHISSDVDNDTIYTRKNEQSGLEKFYKIHVNTDYVDIRVKGNLPDLSPELIEQFLHENAGPEIMENILPFELFSVEGFTIITVEDVTPEQSVQNIRLALVNESSDQNELFERVTHSLQTLTGNSAIEFGLLPFLKVNGKLVYDAEECFSSILIKSSIEQGVAEETYQSMVENYLRNPRAVFFNEISEAKVNKHFYLKALINAGIRSYAILPVYYNRRLAGVMEIYSRRSVIYYEKLLSKLEAAVPLLSQLLHNSAEQFNQRIEDVIKEKFTTLQQSVEWKFNEAAWNYIRQRKNDSERAEMKAINFKDVYPLYGAVDIRNSTNERNNALRQDLVFLLNKVIEILELAQKNNPADVDAVLVKRCRDWLAKVEEQVTDNDETHIRALLQEKVYPLFDELKQAGELQQPIEEYFKAENEETGEGFARRRALEHSIGLINTALNNYFERAQGKLQEIYPCYFEKFRTDGVEYDIYTGEAMSPELPFEMEKLSRFRRWQLKSMIEIIHITGKLTNVMECVLQTTQLIFVHSSPIDICFRKDERRFDVEGAYNIRYEVIKKRIDKVQIKDTGERLTQPNKIAMVYATAPEAEEYLGYVKEFQEKGMLTGEVEQLELEELQGVTGLKAIRVTVDSTSTQKD